MRNKKLTQITPTDQPQALYGAYTYFNETLFGNQLPECILNFSRKRNTQGFLAPYHWRKRDSNDHDTHELFLTSATLSRTPIEMYSSLVHDMVHLWQLVFGHPSRNGYHNREWAEKMKEVGLMPSDTGEPRGKETGQQMAHYIIEGGQYERAFQAIPQNLILPFISIEGDLMNGENGGIQTENEHTKKRLKLRPLSQKKTSYECPKCQVKVWGRPNLHIRCETCQELFRENT